MSTSKFIGLVLMFASIVINEIVIDTRILEDINITCNSGAEKQGAESKDLKESESKKEYYSDDQSTLINVKERFGHVMQYEIYFEQSPYLEVFSPPPEA